jgi:hypothetical protein
MTDISVPRRRGLSRWFRRSPWETAAMTAIGAGILMLTQPFSLDVYSYSFITILAGTVGFVIVSHFPQKGEI